MPPVTAGGADHSIGFDDLERRPGFFATKKPKQVTFLPDPAPRTRHYTLISVDDHLVEPPHLFEGRVPSRFADRAPGSSSTTRAWSTGCTTTSVTTRWG